MTADVVAVDDVDRRPVWLLDIDGVLNVGSSAWGDTLQTGIATIDGGRFKFKWSPALLSQIAQIHAGGEVKIRWCSTWCEDISSPAALFDLHGIPTAFDGDFRDVRAHKFDAAVRVLLHEDRPLIWTDDDIDWIVSTASPDGEMPSAGPARLLIQPEARKGLTPAHVEQIRAFVEEQSTT